MAGLETPLDFDVGAKDVRDRMAILALSEHAKRNDILARHRCRRRRRQQHECDHVIEDQLSGHPRFCSHPGGDVISPLKENVYIARIRHYDSAVKISGQRRRPNCSNWFRDLACKTSLPAKNLRKALMRSRRWRSVNHPAVRGTPNFCCSAQWRFRLEPLFGADSKMTSGQEIPERISCPFDPN